MRNRRVALLCLLVPSAACSQAAPPPAGSAEEAALVEVPAESAKNEVSPEESTQDPPLLEPSPLRDVDLSDERVAGMELTELWQLGVDTLGWPEEMPSGTTKEAVHQELLDEKYRGAVLPLGSE